MSDHLKSGAGQSTALLASLEGVPACPVVSPIPKPYQIRSPLCLRADKLLTRI